MSPPVMTARAARSLRILYVGTFPPHLTEKELCSGDRFAQRNRSLNVARSRSRHGAARRIVHVSIIHKPLDTRVFRKQCRALAAAGYDVHLIVGGAPLEARDGVEFHSIAESDERPPLRRQLPRLARAAGVAFALGASVYHLHDPHLIPLGLALKLGGARVVYDVHEDYAAKAATEHADHFLRRRCKVRMWTALEHLARTWLDSFVCTSQALAARFPADRTVVVGNLPLHREFTAGSAMPAYRDRANTLLYVGSLTRVRGYFEIARALELLPAELECTLRVVGYFRDREVARAAGTLPARGRIEMVPFQPYERVVREMLSARIGIVVLHPLPNHADPARSNKLFEYMAAGLPVIASDLPGWRDIVRGIGCGLVVDPLDCSAIAGAVEYLLTHPANAEAMGRRGRDAVCSELNWDSDRARLLASYRTLTAGGPRATAASPDPTAAA